MYDIILKNNATGKFTIISGQSDVSSTELYLQFDVDIQQPDGEYTYAVVRNNYSGITYDLKQELLASKVSWDGGSAELRDFNPFVGLMRIGDIKSDAVYDDNKQNYFYEG